jgi:hypothetical protein
MIVFSWGGLVRGRRTPNPYRKTLGANCSGSNFFGGVLRSVGEQIGDIVKDRNLVLVVDDDPGY